MWYPENKRELNSMLDGFLKTDKKQKSNKKVHGLIVPHAGYEFSGEVAGKAYSLMSKSEKIDKAVILGLSHYFYLNEVVGDIGEKWETPLGKIKLFRDDFRKINIEHEHSIKNQVPFLQKIGVKEIMPLMVGEISNNKAKEIAEKLAGINALFVFSTDLSHFLPYGEAVKIDRNSIEIIENLDFSRFNKVDACGKYPLLILFHLCKLKGWKPELVEYKNSGDIVGDKSRVVGYASFWF